MLYKRYKMLQKYINGEAQEEYKQGELLSDVTFNTLDACNEGNQNPDKPIEGDIYQWVTVSGEYVCNGKDKYTKEKEQRSSDGGVTWTDTGRTRQGDLIEANSDDCDEPTVEYRWVVVEGQYECVGYDKYEQLKKQQSIDGVNWTDVVPLETMQGDLIERNSTDCGYVPPTPGGYENQYLTFEALENGTFTFTGKNGNSLSYSLDGGQTWTALASGVASPTVTSGNKIMWKGTCTPNNTGSGIFSSNGTFNAYGNTMSIVHGDNFRNSTTISYYQFAFLFQGTKVVNAENLILPATTLKESCYLAMFANSNIKTAPTLPATTLATGCYQQMFQDSPSLTTAPELPATTLADYCYYQMFYGCTRLTTAPALPATTLATYCYYYMFAFCSSLTTAPVLPATTLATYCYQSMFQGCTRLTTAPVLPATTLVSSCYREMFRGCTSLTTAPALPATTLVSSCYYGMFNGCTSLNYIKAMFTTRPSTTYTKNWVSGVASTGTFVKNSAATWNVTGVHGIPSGWTVINE